MVEAAVTADNTCDTKPLRVGLDIGSTTVKAVVLDQTDSLDAVLFSDYRRHHANVRATVAGLLEDIHKELEARGRGDEPIRLAITGSGGLALADNLHVPFVQEVIAETRAIDEEYPQALVVSSRFTGKSRIQRQQMVNALLKSYFDSGELHSLQMQTMTPEEWQAARG